MLFNHLHSLKGFDLYDVELSMHLDDEEENDADSLILVGPNKASLNLVSK